MTSSMSTSDVSTHALAGKPRANECRTSFSTRRRDLRSVIVTMWLVKLTTIWQRFHWQSTILSIFTTAVTSNQFDNTSDVTCLFTTIYDSLVPVFTVLPLLLVIYLVSEASWQRLYSGYFSKGYCVSNNINVSDVKWCSVCNKIQIWNFQSEIIGRRNTVLQKCSLNRISFNFGFKICVLDYLISLFFHTCCHISNLDIWQQVWKNKRKCIDSQTCRTAQSHYTGYLI